MENWSSSRPGSVAQAGPRPTLDDVLSDRAQPPYTLTAFMAYLSQNHCLETLEFTMDSKRYGDHYEVVSDELRESPIHSEGPRSQHLCGLFQRLLSAYVQPGALREINLPSSVRDALLSHSNTRRPPLPSVLDTAVRRMRELMDESIFMPFLNSRSASVPQAPSAEASPTGRTQRQPTRHPPPQPPTAHMASGSSSAAIAAQRAGYYSSTRGSSSGDSASGNLTDDSGSNPSSPGGGGGDPVTPPTTPHSGELHSPRGRQDNAWKKVGAKFGWKK